MLDIKSEIHKCTVPGIILSGIHSIYSDKGERQITQILRIIPTLPTSIPQLYNVKLKTKCITDKS